MFLILASIGGFLAVLGGLIFIVDAFKVHWGWGLATIFIPLANVVCLIKHWAATKRGFLMWLLAIPFLGGAAYLAPKKDVKNASGKVEKINDPFYNAMQKARAAVVKVQEARQPEKPATPPVISTSKPTTEGSAVLPAPTALTVTQRLANNRAAFTSLETEFSNLQAKRQSLPKKDKTAIAAFNQEAKVYTEKLAEVRSEQKILLELDRTGGSK